MSSTGNLCVCLTFKSSVRGQSYLERILDAGLLVAYHLRVVVVTQPRNLLQNNETYTSLRQPIWFSELEVL